MLCFWRIAPQKNEISTASDEQNTEENNQQINENNENDC